MAASDSSHREGYSSSESGWTMYIGSPMQDDDDGIGSDDQSGYSISRRTVCEKNESNSDDSMASDASSGQVHRQHVGKGGGESSRGRNRSKHGKGENVSTKNSSGKKGSKLEKKGGKR